MIKTKKDNLKEAGPQNDEIQTWSGRFMDASGNQATLFAAYQRWYDNFFAVFKENIAPWRSKVLDPKLASKAMSVIAKVSLFNPEPNLKPRSKYDFIKAKNNEELLKYQTSNPDFDIPMFFKRYSTLTDSVVCGYGLAMLPWKKMDKKIYKRVMAEGKIDFANDKEIIEKIGFNDFIPWSVFRAYCTPGATSWGSAQWKILTDFKGTNEIKKFCQEMDFKFDEKLLEDKGDGNVDTYEDSRNRLLNQGSRKGKKELWICYDETDKEFVYILNKKVLLGKQKNIYWHQRFPIVPFYLRPRAFSPFGDGLFERAERLGAAGNTLINHFLDQLDLSMNGLILHDENTTINADMTPGGSIIYSGANPPTPWAVEQPDAQGFQLARNIINESIEENTIANYSSGTARSNMDNTQGTKGGTLAIMDEANDMVRLFKQCYAESAKMVYTQWMSNNQQFMDRKVALRVLGANGYYPKEISPEDIYTQGTIDVEVDVDAMESASRDVEANKKLAYVDKQLMILDASIKAGNPVKLNFYELSTMIGSAMNVSESERIVEPTPIQSDSPTQENELMLQGKELEPQQGEDHKTHIMIHQELISDEGVDKDLLDNVIAPHIAIHQQFLDQILKQVDDAARIAASNAASNAANIAGGNNANQTNQGQNQVIPQGQQAGLDQQMAGPGQVGPPAGNSNPNAGIQGSIPAL